MSFKYILIFFLFFNILIAGISAQIAPNRYWVQFNDKRNSSFSIDKPEEFLSERSIARRLKHNVEIDSVDLPVNASYIDSLKKIGLTIINTSKWLNGVIAETLDTSLLSEVLKLNFVSDIPMFYEKKSIISLAKNKFIVDQKDAGFPLYGASANQIEMLNGQYLHEDGFFGNGILIAVLDAGFSNANIISSLNHLWEENRVVTFYDFVKDGSSFFNTYQHGTVVLSVMAGIEDSIIFGTAPKAEYVLLRTEKNPTEYLIEEYNWVCGAEFADSIGADLINSSLSYTQFDNVYQDHTYNDLDGKSNISTIGASIASSKGILVEVSAGNYGNDSWYHIGSPADADGILTVGAVNSDGIVTNFSSRGPTADGRIKPDICAQGQNVFVQNQSGDFVPSSGTSVSGPVISGLAACLWQANPDASNLQIIEAIRESSSQHLTPDNEYGYGIPDFGKADRILKSIFKPQEKALISIYSYPNPATDLLNVEIYQKNYKTGQQIFITVNDITGRIVQETSFSTTGMRTYLNLDIENIPTGIYRLGVYVGEILYSSLFIVTK